MHFELFIKRLLLNSICPVKVLSWGQYNQPESVWELLTDTIQKEKKENKSLPTVKLVSSFDPSPNIYVYNDDNSIVDFYQSIETLSERQYEVTEEQKASQEKMKSYHSVAIPYRALLIDPKEKGVNEEIVQSYDVVFHRNEYKRVVLWHLSHGQHVIFVNEKQ